MTPEETKQSLEEQVERYQEYVDADLRELQRAKLTLQNDQRLLKLVKSQLEAVKESSADTLKAISGNLK